MQTIGDRKKLVFFYATFNLVHLSYKSLAELLRASGLHSAAIHRCAALPEYKSQQMM